jgi:hypothetical protein
MEECERLPGMQGTQTLSDPMDRLYPLADFVPVLERHYGIERSYQTLYRWAMRKEKPLPVTRLAGVMMCSLRMFEAFLAPT